MSDHPFDDLARTLAAGASRRGVLKALGGAVLGSVVAAPPRPVLAQGNSDCAHFCNDVELPGPGRGQCTSDAAHGQGLCYTCGPAAAAGHPDVCGVATSGVACCPAATPNCCGNTSCVSLASDVQNCGACGKQCTTSVANAYATCTGGTCGFVCNTGYKLCNGTCIATSACCTAADCPTPTNGTATCTNGTCGITCNSGYAVCGTAPNQVCCGGCCQNGTCQSGITTSACGTGGAACAVCNAGQVCTTSGTCCTPTTCTAQGVTCGLIPDSCGGTLNCGTCPTGQTCMGGTCCANANVCGSTCCGTGQVCYVGACFKLTDNTCSGCTCGGCDGVTINGTQQYVCTKELRTTCPCPAGQFCDALGFCVEPC